jgi:hypothetical protein
LIALIILEAISAQSDSGRVLGIITENDDNLPLSFMQKKTKISVRWFLAE